MAIPGVSGLGAVNLDQLAALYQRQVLAGSTGAAGTAGLPGTAGAAGVAGVAGTAGVAGIDPAAAARGSDFAGAVGQSLQQLSALDQTAQTKAIQAATGNLSDIQDYVIAANQAQVATELTTTVRNKAVDAFNEIMRMPL